MPGEPAPVADTLPLSPTEISISLPLFAAQELIRNNDAAIADGAEVA